MKSKQVSNRATQEEISGPALSTIRRQLAYLQEETKTFGCPEISLFLGCAVLAIDELKQGRQGLAT